MIKRKCRTEREDAYILKAKILEYFSMDNSITVFINLLHVNLELNCIFYPVVSLYILFLLFRKTSINYNQKWYDLTINK